MQKIILIILFSFLVSCGELSKETKKETKDRVGLSLEHKKEFDPQIFKVTDNVYSGVGYGLANSIMIETEEGLVIVDTLGSEETASLLFSEFRKISNKPVKAIIYTPVSYTHLTLPTTD